MFSARPEELLQAIVECIAYDTSFQLPLCRWKFAKAELLSLSATNQQFRRLCLPFLFGYVSVKCNEDLKRFVDQCIINSALAASIRTLDLFSTRSYPLPPDCSPSLNLMSNILLLLGNISQINLRNIHLERRMLAMLNHHPGMTVFLELGQGTMGLMAELRNPVERIDSLDLSRTVLLSLIAYGQKGVDNVEIFSTYGLQVWSLQIVKEKEDLDDSLKGLKVHGLCTLTMTDFTEPKWFRKFTQAHPLLKNINLYGDQPGYTIPFLDTLFQQIRKEKVGYAVSVIQSTLTRVNPEVTADLNLEPFGEWCISALSLHLFHWLSGRILRLLQSSCPHISTLTIEVGKYMSTIPFDEFVTLLGSFASLRVLGLIGHIEELDLGTPNILLGSELKTAVLLYTSRIALRIPTIEAFSVKLYRGRFEIHEPKENWYFEGQLEVANLGIEGRHTVISHASH